MGFKLKIFLASGLFALVCFWGFTQVLQAEPDPDYVGPQEKIYQQVKNLENYGLLDPNDQALLDDGRSVTRMELASYVEKALDKIQPKPQAQPEREYAFYRDQPDLRTSPPPPPILYTPTPVSTPTPSIDPELLRQIQDLLK